MFISVKKLLQGPILPISFAGLAVADRLGAPYPFSHDKLATQQVGKVSALLYAPCRALELGLLSCSLTCT
jgi:hypothetical protein